MNRTPPRLRSATAVPPFIATGTNRTRSPNLGPGLPRWIDGRLVHPVRKSAIDERPDRGSLESQPRVDRPAAGASCQQSAATTCNDCLRRMTARSRAKRSSPRTMRSSRFRASPKTLASNGLDPASVRAEESRFISQLRLSAEVSIHGKRPLTRGTPDAGRKRLMRWPLGRSDEPLLPRAIASFPQAVLRNRRKGQWTEASRGRTRRFMQKGPAMRRGPRLVYSSGGSRSELGPAVRVFGRLHLPCRGRSAG